MLKHSHAILRYTLAIIFLWFGFLKLFGVSPIASIIEQVYPFIIQIKGLYYLLALTEIAIGAGLLIKRTAPYASILLIAHLTIATFGILFNRMAYDGGFPNLTMVGEFVVKNFALMAAGFVVYQDKNR